MIPENFMSEAIRLGEEAMRTNRGGPFGCVVVRRGEIVGRGENRVTSACDPTAHAEVTAIREACQKLDAYRLDDCELYTSCEPCPMCLAAIYWARIPTVYYASTRADAAAVGFDDDEIYRQLALPIAARSVKMEPLMRAAALSAFTEWAAKPDKIEY